MGAKELPKLLASFSAKSSRARGVDQLSVQELRRLRVFDVDEIAQHTLEKAIHEYYT